MDKLEKMALGRRAAYLRRCIQVLELVEQYETQLTVRRRVFDVHIKPVMNCSYTTFNNMLNEKNPRKELDLITKQMNQS